MEKIFRKSLEVARAMYPGRNSEVASRSLRSLHWSFVFDKSRLIAVEENTKKTHARNRFNIGGRTNVDLGFKNICAELQVFLKVKNKFNVENLNWAKLTLVNVRIDLNGEIRNSAPCHFCKSLINYLNIKNIYFTNNDGNFERYYIG